MIEMHGQYFADMHSREGSCAESFLCSSIDVVNTCVSNCFTICFFCGLSRLGHTPVHVMIEMHGQYVVDMRSSEGFYAESFLCLSMW